MSVQAKKSLGQNFLHSKGVVNTMLDAGAIDSHDIVVEAGPGKGILTQELLSCARQVIAIEKDPRLIFFLSLKFKKEITEGKLKLIVARDGKESILSIAVKVYGTPRYVDKVSAKLFNPRPRVDSAILLISNISKKFFTTVDERRFFEILRLGFSQKRKMLLGNLSSIAPRERLVDIFKDLDIPEKARAENLAPSKWKGLVLAIK